MHEQLFLLYPRRGESSEINKSKRDLLTIKKSLMIRIPADTQKIRGFIRPAATRNGYLGHFQYPMGFYCPSETSLKTYKERVITPRNHRTTARPQGLIRRSHS